MLDRLDDLIVALKLNAVSIFAGTLVQTGSLYCPKCGDERRMTIHVLSAPQKITSMAPKLIAQVSKPEDFVPTLIFLTCVQCWTRFTGVIYQGPDGPDAVILPSIRGGLTTHHTPEGVAYYLDQAHRAEVMGARSAAVAMYRGALEQLLFEQGYTKGMLKQKLDALEAGIKAGTAPKWAAELDTDFLTVLKQLGDGSIHPKRWRRDQAGRARQRVSEGREGDVSVAALLGVRSSA